MPYLRVVVQQFPPENLPAVQEYSKNTVEPALANATGLRHWVAGNDQSGVGLTMSVWDTKEQAEAGLSAVVPGAPAHIRVSLARAG